MKFYLNFKCFFDFIFALLFFSFFLIPILILALVILLFDGCPIFYISTRVGKDFRNFKMYKFRSMKNASKDLRNDDGTTFSSNNDARLTKLGKFLRKYSLDELPQIFNVLKGEMSFIGPRPDLPDQIKIYKSNNLPLNRFKIKPGISGYAQVKGRNSFNIVQRTQFDEYYFNNISFLLDIKIIFQTVLNVLLSKNVNKNENNKR
jgi:lipopolysaccharide/colanic/teichoic acid biosynthesis glycosyltransferase